MRLQHNMALWVRSKRRKKRKTYNKKYFTTIIILISVVYAMLWWDLPVLCAHTRYGKYSEWPETIITKRCLNLNQTYHKCIMVDWLVHSDTWTKYILASCLVTFIKQTKLLFSWIRICFNLFPPLRPSPLLEQNCT